MIFGTSLNIQICKTLSGITLFKEARYNKDIPMFSQNDLSAFTILGTLICKLKQAHKTESDNYASEL